MIVTNAVTNEPLKYGDGNRYRSDSKKVSIPRSDEEWEDCTQRNNNTYGSLNDEAGTRGAGFCALGYSAKQKILIMIIKPHNTNGNLDGLRNKLFDVGVEGACFTDGSNSACMAIDGNMVTGCEPADYKNNLIETGFALFYYKKEEGVTLTIEFHKIEVIDDKSILGEGVWTLYAEVNGERVTLLDEHAVNENDTVKISHEISVTVSPSKNETLKIEVYGTDTAYINDDLGKVSEEYSAASSPKWGVGNQTIESSNHSHIIHFKIKEAE